jgi:hypothetical protein
MTMADNHPPSFAGKTYRFEVDNGYVFLNTYSASGDSLRWEAIEGPTTGQTETVALFVAEIGLGMYFVSWA